MVEIDENTPFEILLPLAESDDAFAQAHLGARYFDGTGVDLDLKEAVKWFQKAAEQGLPGAQYLLGNCYEHGLGTKMSAEEAYRWYRRAAEQDFALGQNALGVCFYNGTGVGKNRNEMIKWFQKAAEQGLVDAQFNLGIVYKEGTLGEQNFAEAKKWFQQAADQGHADAQKELRMIPSDTALFWATMIPMLVFLGVTCLWYSGIRRITRTASKIAQGWEFSALPQIQEQRRLLTVATEQRLLLNGMLAALIYCPVLLIGCSILQGLVSGMEEHHPALMTPTVGISAVFFIAYNIWTICTL